MKQTGKSKIFLSQERGISESPSFRSYRTFNFGTYFNEHKAAFGAIQVLNDDMLAGAQCIKTLVEESVLVMVIPIAGAAAVQVNTGDEILVAAGQVWCYNAIENIDLNICNPFENDTVNFIQLWVKINTVYQQPVNAEGLITFDDVNAHLSQLVNIISQQASFFDLLIGKFNGREEVIYHTNNTAYGLLAFVLHGAFEINGCLLHARDTLAIWDTDTADIEALSNGAILLLMEVPL